MLNPVWLKTRPVNGAALPALPDVEFIALAAKRLSQPAGTLPELLETSGLHAGAAA